MPALTDRQRIELAIPAYLIYALTGAPDVFVPADPELAARAQADVAQLRADLRTACLEPFADLAPAKRQALIRRLERIKRLATTDWHERPALDLMLMLWCFLKDLTDREILILWEASVMDRAIRKLMPMCEHGFENLEDGVAAEARPRTARPPSGGGTISLIVKPNRQPLSTRLGRVDSYLRFQEAVIRRPYGHPSLRRETDID